MKKFIVILFVILFAFFDAFSQKGNDHGGTGGNNNTKPKNTDNNNSGTSDGLLLQITKIIFGAYQQVLISKKGSDPAVFGLEAGAEGGLLNGNYESLISVDPRIRYNKGALSFDVRYDYLTGNSAKQNLDVLAEFNVIVKDFKLAIGQGIMYDIDNENMYHESYLGIDLGFDSKQILISPEFRLAYDWSVHKPANTEISLKGGYRILNLPFAAVYLNVGAGYRYMGENMNYSMVFGGFNFMF